MKLKSAVPRALLGFALGVFTGFVTMLIVSAFIGNGQFVPVLDRLKDLCGGEMKALLVQTVLTGLIGVAYALASFFFETRWSLLAQFAAYFAATFPVLVAVVLFCWMPEQPGGLISTLAPLPAGYVVTFFVRLGRAKSDVQCINERIEEYNENLEGDEKQ